MSSNNNLPAASTQNNGNGQFSNIILTSENVVKVNDMELTMENGMLPMLGIFCSSVVLLVATINNSDGMNQSMRGYANSVAAISMILSFVFLAKIKFVEPIAMYIRYFLFVWSFVGGCVLTFGSGPFSKTGNGFFCSWGMVICSFLSIGISVESLRGAVRENATPLVGLGLCAFLVFLSTLSYIGTKYNWESILATVVSVATIGFVSYAFAKFKKNSKLPNSAFQVLAGMSILWVFVAGVTTFRGPFLVTGNGYFSVWAGAILSAVACNEAHKNDNEEDMDMAEAPPSPVLASPPNSPAGHQEEQSQVV